jgi:hypothetical protein
VTESSAYCSAQPKPVRAVFGVRSARLPHLALVVTAAMLGLGMWLRWPNVEYRGLPVQSAYNEYAFAHFSYSDIASLFYRDKLSVHPRPFFDYELEYPVGMGLVIYIMNFARRMPSYFLVTTFFMATCGLATAWLIPRFPRGRIWLLALSPSLAFYVNLNWDMWAIFLTVGALLLFVRRRDDLATVALAAAVWTKFFPIVMLPLILVERARSRQWRAIARILAIFAAVSVAINAPIFILRREAWLIFFRYSRTRQREVNLWNFFDRWQLTTDQINTLSLGLLMAGMLVLAWAIWKGQSGAFLPACCAAIAWFFFINKVYSPQYSLWVTVLLAVVGSAPALAVAWSAADLLYFAASFLILGLSTFGNRDVTDWYYQYALTPAMAIREAILLLVALWCLRHMRVGNRLQVTGNS